MTVWLAFSRGEFFGHDMPPGPSSFVGVYATREEALEHCYPPGDPLFVEERTIPAQSDHQATPDEPGEGRDDDYTARATLQAALEINAWNDAECRRFASIAEGLREALHQIAQGETPNGYVNEPTVCYAQSVLHSLGTSDQQATPDEPGRRERA